MKAILFALVAIATFSTFSAQAEVKLVSENDNGVSIRVTGKDVATLQAVLENGSLDEGAGKNDYSTIRSLTCDKDSCTIVARGSLLTAADSQDYYTKDFQKTLKSLKANQVLLTGHMGEGNDGTVDEFDGRVTRALMNAHFAQADGVEAKLERNLKTKITSDLGSVVVMTASAGTEVKIKCYTSVELQMGVQNFTQNTCNVDAVVNK